jgi:hypothetical protein
MKLKILGAGLTGMLMACSPAPEEAVVETQAVPAVVAAAPEPMVVKAVNTSFIPAGFSAPTLVEAEGFKLVPLGPELVKIDFDAYMSSIKHLQETYSRTTSWPREGISDADAMLDMETEQKRFEARESFAYGVLTPDGTREFGSLYVRPSKIPGYDAVVSMWVTKADFDAGFDAKLYTWATQWVAAEWPFAKVAYPGRDIDWATWDGLVATAENIQTAEGMIDAFYSFDPTQLGPILAEAGDSGARILGYQAWAEGGNYKVLNRGACETETTTVISCGITVQDDPVVQLNTGFNVTDTFHLTFEGPSIVDVNTSSDDQPIYYEARKWVEANMPEVMAGPCLKGADGIRLTSGDCARAMTEGYRLFYVATRGEGASES